VFAVDVPRQNVPDPIPDPAPNPTSQVPAPLAPALAAPMLVMVKQEVEQFHHLPPSGSVDNPMEIDDSDDEIIVLCSTPTPKRKKTGMAIVGNPLPVAELVIIAPPPGRETPGKRSRPESNHPSGSEDPTPATMSQTQVVSVNVAGPPQKPVRGSAVSFRVDVTHPLHLVGFVWELQVEAT